MHKTQILTWSQKHVQSSVPDVATELTPLNESSLDGKSSGYGVVVNSPTANVDGCDLSTSEFESDVTGK